LKLDAEKQKFGDNLAALYQNLIIMNILLATSTLAFSYAETSRMYQRRGPSGEQEEI